MTEPPAVQTMTDADLNAIKAQAERDRSEIEKARLALEQTFAKKWAPPLLGLAGVIVAGVFSVAAVLVASSFKNAEDLALNAQRDATATAEANSRADRLKLDIANFVMANWQTFSKGSPNDQQAIVIVTSELFPPYVSRNVVDKLAAMIPGKLNENAQDAINLLQPRYDLSGAWRCTARCQSSNNPAAIQQTTKGLIFTNEVGNVSNGVYKSATQFAAIEWGDLGGIVQEGGRTITWLNGSVWTKIIEEARTRASAGNSVYTVFPHYRRANQPSLDFRQVVRTRLTEQGFRVAGDTGDSDVKPTAEGGAEGPHISYFIDQNHPDDEQQKTKNAALAGC